jgi:hypothetical protein
MIRSDELKSVVGKNAYSYYSYWISRKNRGSCPIETFGKSRLFNQFYKFANWVSNMNLPDKKLYIRFNILKGFTPDMWTSNEVYVKFIDWIDIKWNAEDHFKYTYLTLRQIAKKEDCELNMAILNIPPNQILTLVRCRKLSPWVLLKMKSFRQVLINLSQEQKIHFQETIRPSHWSKIIKDPNLKEDNYIIAEAVKRAKM